MLQKELNKNFVHVAKVVRGGRESNPTWPPSTPPLRQLLSFSTTTEEVLKKGKER